MGRCGPRVDCMETATQPRVEFVSVEDYLDAEAGTEVRHEYLGGVVYAMAGETREHNEIMQNLAFSLRRHVLRGGCKLYLSDIKVNFEIRGDEYFYYPDLVVTCDKRDTDRLVLRYPKLIIEVLSPSTERTDRREKFLAYTNIATLEEYALVGQKPREVTVFRRTRDWKSEVIAGAKAKLTLSSLKLSVPLSAIYEGV